MELRRDRIEGENVGVNIARELRTYSPGSYSLTSVSYSGICNGEHAEAVLRALVGRGDVGIVNALKGSSLLACHESSARGSTELPVLLKGPFFEWLDRLLDMGCETWVWLTEHEAVSP